MIIEFKYKNPHSKEWTSVICDETSVEACKTLHGLDSNSEYQIVSVTEDGVKFSVGQTAYRHYDDPMSFPRTAEVIIKSLEGEKGLYDAIVIDTATETMLYVDFSDLTLS